MRDTIYLVVDQTAVRRMTKSLPTLHHGEIPVKLNIEVKPSAFREPVIERSVEIVDWREGLDFADIDLNEATITEAEAELIRSRRLEAMEQVLRDRGYKVEAPPDATVAGPGDEWPGDRDGG